MKKLLSIISLLLILAVPCQSQDIDVAMVAKYTGLKTYEFATDFTTSPSEFLRLNGTQSVSSGILASAQANGFALYLLNKPYQLIDGTIQVDYRATTGYEYGGVVFRVQGYSTYYRLSISGQYSPDFYLQKCVDGTFTTLDTTSAGSYSTWTTYRIELDGSSIKVYFGDTLAMEATDSTFDKGYVALYHTRASGGAQWDNLSIDMTYEDDTQTGIVGTDEGTIEDTGMNGYDRFFASEYATNQMMYPCTQSGEITKLYYEQDASLDISVTNLLIGSMYYSSSGAAASVNYSDGEGTNIGGNVSEYTLVKPMIVLAGYSYALGSRGSDSSWDCYGLPDTGATTGASSGGAGPDEPVYGMGIQYGTVANYRLKMWGR